MIPPVPPGQPNRLTLARRFTVGELLSDELVARGWTPTQLAVACRLPQGTIDGVIAGTVVITPEIAEQIGLGLGTSAGMWIALGALGPHSRSSLKNKGDTGMVRTDAQIAVSAVEFLAGSCYPSSTPNWCCAHDSRWKVEVEDKDSSYCEYFEEMLGVAEAAIGAFRSVHMVKGNNDGS